MINPYTVEKVIYKNGEVQIQTHVYKDKDGIERCAYSGYLNNKPVDMTVEEYLREKEQEGFKLVPFDEALEQIRLSQDTAFLTGWTEIDEERWMDALECLPPRKWKTVDDVEIFQMSEMTAGDITAHYVRYGERYFCGNRRIWDKYQDIAIEIKTIA